MPVRAINHWLLSYQISNFEFIGCVVMLVDYNCIPKASNTHITYELKKHGALKLCMHIAHKLGTHIGCRRGLAQTYVIEI